MAEQQRRQHRIGVALDVFISGHNRHGLPFEEMTHSNDVSRGGCSFYTSHEIAEGAELNIEILRHLTGSQSSFQTRGQVVRTRQEAPEQFFVAVRFVGPQFPTYSSENTG
ncbi:MAG TPA: PilZ domain-containing protein [Terriglobia bacterium]|nr:PilZ domain-containing protein [Terriglobia bacterium]